MRNGKAALVTGSSTGIGAGIARSLAAAGYDVALHCNSSRAKAEQLQQELAQYGVNTCLLQANIAEPEVPEQLVQKTVEQLGRLDVLVNNAGVTVIQLPGEMSAAAMDHLYHVDFRGMVLGASAAAKYMKENGIYGSILFNTSVRSFNAHSNDAVYGGMKAGLNRVIESFAVNLGRYGIRVNGFSPGVINVSCPVPEDERKSAFYRNTHKFIPLRRNGYAEDIGNAVVFLASEQASYITGQVLRIDGGLSVVGAPEHLVDLLDAFDVDDLTHCDRAYLEAIDAEINQKKMD